MTYEGKLMRITAHFLTQTLKTKRAQSEVCQDSPNKQTNKQPQNFQKIHHGRGGVMSETLSEDEQKTQVFGRRGETYIRIQKINLKGEACRSNKTDV